MDTLDQDTKVQPQPEDTDAPQKPRTTKRKYSLALKREIVEETLKGVESVSVIARRYDVNANMVFRWRRLYEKGELVEKPANAVLFPVTMAPEASVAQPASIHSEANTVQSANTIEVVFPGGARVTLTGTVSSEMIQATFKALSP